MAFLLDDMEKHNNAILDEIEKVKPRPKPVITKDKGTVIPNNKKNLPSKKKK